ncbi:MAG: hypothetical protein AUH78_03495 [Gemmatimonadetes bacterium 13_1_40CM_4_69_8]|nr:MAG: hypothetical protein AUH78_03495 [Gemmatimonadetes bacterium 13_1_40CM_4_69_8]
MAPHCGSSGAGERPEGGRIHRDVAPAEDRQLDLLERALNQGDRASQRRVLLGKKEHAEREPPARPGARQEAARDLGQHAGSIPRVVVRCGAAMGQAGERGERHPQDVMGGLPGGLCYEADAARVLLSPGRKHGFGARGGRRGATKSPLGGGSGLGARW